MTLYTISIYQSYTHIDMTKKTSTPVPIRPPFCAWRSAPSAAQLQLRQRSDVLHLRTAQGARRPRRGCQLVAGYIDHIYGVYIYIYGIYGVYGV